MKINPSIFKAYDIRGHYPDEINEKVAYKIGQVFAKYAKVKEIIVSRDCRLSSNSLANSLISGINSQGIKVIDIGLNSIPAFYFAVNHYHKQAGIMVTASHLRKEFNGFKPVLKNAKPLTREEVLELKAIALSKIKILSENKQVVKKNVTDKYVKRIKSFIKGKFKKFKVVMDAGNAMAGLYIEKVFKDTGLDIIPLFTSLDGNFPNHEPNVKIPANRVKLAKKILEEKADLGFMWDGDADRLYILDNEGKVIDPNFVSAIIARYLVRQSDKKNVVVDIRASKVIKDFVSSVKGKVIVTKCWHANIKQAMRKQDAVFGSETSGHYIFSDFYYIDDGILASLIFLQAISQEKKSIFDLVNELRNKYFIIEETNFRIKSRAQARRKLDKIGKYYSKVGGKISKLDGISVEFKNWRFNLRLSETEPLLRLNLDASSKQVLLEKKKEVSSLILRF